MNNFEGRLLSFFYVRISYVDINIDLIQRSSMNKARIFPKSLK